jgi:protein involved in polysaccharide export with SLBB domain
MVMVLNTLSKVRGLGFAFAVLATSRGAFAQTPAPAEKPLNFETRAELQALAKKAAARDDNQELYLIRYRLEHGDFQDGDRIILRVVRGSGGFSDTLVVRAGKHLQLPQVGDISLEGVLRSELVPTLSTYLGKYIRDPAVEASQLVRVGILGSVGRPGFYYFPADLPLSDVLMGAGGPTPVADLGKVSVRRNGDVIIDEKNTRTALTNGMSMDFLHMVAGDEISVGEKKPFPWGLVLPVATTVLGLALTYHYSHR